MYTCVSTDAVLCNLAVDRKFYRHHTNNGKICYFFFFFFFFFFFLLMTANRVIVLVVRHCFQCMVCDWFVENDKFHPLPHLHHHTHTHPCWVDVVLTSRAHWNIGMCTTINRCPIFSTRYSEMCKVYTCYHGTSEIEHGLFAFSVDNPLAKARGLSLRTGSQAILYLSHTSSFFYINLLSFSNLFLSEVAISF